ncbi:MAG: hypothetical protein AAF412_02230 [Pseudomonadota bacterium]
MSAKDPNRIPVFDYRTLRLLIGIIAFALPFTVLLLAGDLVGDDGEKTGLGSISAGYHTDAHDAFVGMLFIVGAFLLAYRGHDIYQSAWSKVAAMCAWIVAIFPTKCRFAESMCEYPKYLDTFGDASVLAKIHFCAAVTLFIILACFAFWPFRSAVKGKTGPRRIRSGIYMLCAFAMAASVIAVSIVTGFRDGDMAHKLGVTFWGELVALVAFGIAWIVAGKALPPLQDPDHGDDPPLFGPSTKTE